jgi:hypothetical protein
MYIEMKMPRLDVAAHSGFFPGFAFRSLAVRHRLLRIAFRKRPLATAVGVHQQELNRRPAVPVAHSRYLQRKRES